jgi:hypothetical protein
MSALQLTRGDIIQEGLSLAGRPDLLSDARLWLNLFLEKLYYNQDFDWLIKSVSGLAATQGQAFPSDYRAARSAWIEGNEIKVLSNPMDYDVKRKSMGSSQGVPQFIYADHDIRQFFFLPQPSAGLSWDLRYYYMPTLPDHSDPTSDLLVPKWGLPMEILVDFVKSRAMEYDDDSRQESASSRVYQEIITSKMNNHDRRAGPSRLSMGRRFSKRFK